MSDGTDELTLLLDDLLAEADNGQNMTRAAMLAERISGLYDTLRAQLSEAQARLAEIDSLPVWREKWCGSGCDNNGDSMRMGSHIYAYQTHLSTNGEHVAWLGDTEEAHAAATLLVAAHNKALTVVSNPDPALIGHLGCHPVSPAAQVAQGVADDVVRDYPEGWVFHSADFSMAASCPARSGRVTLVRDLAGRDWWVSLSDEDKERVPLYVYGSGNTLSDAIKDAALLAAAQQQKDG